MKSNSKTNRQLGMSIMKECKQINIKNIIRKQLTPIKATGHFLLLFDLY